MDHAPRRRSGAARMPLRWSSCPLALLLLALGPFVRMPFALVLLASAPVLPGAAFAQSCLTEAGAPSCGGGGDPGSNGQGKALGRHVGNPIDIVSGNKYQAGHDYRAFDSPLAFNRHYNSNLVEHDVGLGRGWRHGYSVVLSRNGDGLRVVQGDGRSILFAAERTTEDDPADGADREPGRFVATDPADGHIEVDDGHVWVLPDGRRLHFHGSWLVGVDYPDGQHLALRYRARRLDTVRDDAGRTLRLVYAPERAGLPRYGDDAQVPPGHLARIELPDGTAVRYRYDDRRNLVSAIDDAGRGLRHAYEDAAWPNHLSGIEDDASRRLGGWRYDAIGRAVAWAGPQPGEGVEIDYIDDARAVPSGRTRVRYPNGDESVHVWARSGEAGGYAYSILSRERIAGGSASGDRRGRAPGPAPVGDRTTSTRPAGNMPIVGSRDVTVPLGKGESATVTLDIDRLGGIADVAVGTMRISDYVPELDAGRVLRRCDAERTGSAAERLRRRARMLAERTGGVASGPLCEEDVLALYELTRRAAVRAGDAAAGGLPSRKQQFGEGEVCPLPTHLDCDRLRHAREMAELSACAYPGASCDTRWRPVSPDSIGMTEDQFDIGGRPARLFHDSVNDRYTLSFRGTTNFDDWDDNLLNGAGLNSEQYARAARLADRVNRQLQHRAPSSALTFTGHSLGGGLATVAALRTENHAVVFNAAALHEDTAAWNSTSLEQADYYVNVVRVDGDIVSSGQRVVGAVSSVFGNVLGRGDAPGYHSVLPRPEQGWIDAARTPEGVENPEDLEGMESIVLHGIDAVRESLDSMIDLHCGPMP